MFAGVLFPLHRCSALQVVFNYAASNFRADLKAIRVTRNYYDKEINVGFQAKTRRVL